MSVVVHIVLVALYGLAGGTDFVSPPPSRIQTSASPDPGLAVVNLAETESLEPLEAVELPETPEEPEPAPEEPNAPENTAPDPTEVAAAPDTVVAGTSAEDAGEDVTLAERLQPRMNDPRLWAPLERDYADLTGEERAELLLRGMIQDWNDSVAIAAALAEEARDWTYTDDQGRRWGLGPGGLLHLGDFAIPIPFSIAVPPGRRDQWLEDQQIRDDLARGAATAAIRETWAERARAIRDRMEAERDADSGTDRPPEPSGGRGGSDPG